MKVEDMYVLMDGTQADPADVKRGDDGVLRHRNGQRVAINGEGKPETVGDRSALNARAAGHDEPKAKPADGPADPPRSNEAAADLSQAKPEDGAA